MFLTLPIFPLFNFLLPPFLSSYFFLSFLSSFYSFSSYFSSRAFVYFAPHSSSFSSNNKAIIRDRYNSLLFCNESIRVVHYKTLRKSNCHYYSQQNAKFQQLRMPRNHARISIECHHASAL